MEAVTDAGIIQEEEEVIVDTVVGAAASITDIHLTPCASSKNRLAGMDPEVTRM